MKKNRLKLQTVAPQTREQLEQLVAEIRFLTLQKQTVLTVIEQRKATIDRENEHLLTNLTERLAQKFASAQLWANANRDTEFAKTKTLELIHGKLGFRTPPPSVKQRSGWSVKRTIAAIKNFGFPFIRSTEAIDKDKIIAQRDNLLDGDLKHIGLRIAQDEEFFLEPNIEQAETRQTATANAA